MNKICKKCEYADWFYNYVKGYCKDCEAGSNYKSRVTHTFPKPITEAQWEEMHETS